MINIQTDQGAHENYLLRELLTLIKKSLPDIKEKPFNAKQVYRNVIENICPTCYISVKMEAPLRIRHGTSLVGRNIIWEIALRETETPIVVRQVLKGLARHN